MLSEISTARSNAALYLYLLVAVIQYTTKSPDMSTGRFFSTLILGSNLESSDLSKADMFML